MLLLLLLGGIGFVLLLILPRVGGIWLRTGLPLAVEAARVCCPLLLGMGSCDLARGLDRRSRFWTAVWLLELLQD